MRELTYQDLIMRLYDLKRLARTPVSGERTACSSSYDRRSQYNSETGLYEHWDANNDGDGYIRKEGEGIVALEQHGPGVIWRVWSALANNGHIKIYIDYDLTPVIDMPFRDFFERMGEGVPPLNVPELTPTLSRGRNRFIPIPFNHYCKVVLMPHWGKYYHFTHTSFPEGTRLPKFTADVANKDWIALAQADRHLANRGWQLPEELNSEVDKVSIEILPDETLSIIELYGSRAITGLRVTTDIAEDEQQDALRELALSIKWDGEAKPSVWSPLGDFFGTAPGINYYRSLPLGMTPAITFLFLIIN